MPIRNALRLLAIVLIACLLQRVRDNKTTPAEVHTLFALAVLALCADAVVYKTPPSMRVHPHAAGH